jgi:hypothetical protein
MAGRTRFGAHSARFGGSWPISQGHPTQFGGVPWAWEVKTFGVSMVLATVLGAQGVWGKQTADRQLTED